jgi:hypothetical protein
VKPLEVSRAIGLGDATESSEGVPRRCDHVLRRAGSRVLDADGGPPDSTRALYSRPRGGVDGPRNDLTRAPAVAIVSVLTRMRPVRVAPEQATHQSHARREVQRLARDYECRRA